MKWIVAAIGAFATLLGGLWLVQGMGIVTIPPILCVIECETLEGPSPGWAIAGAGLLLAGLSGLYFSLRRS